VTFEQAIGLADNISTALIVVFLAYGVWKKHIVVGWTYIDCETEKKELRTLLNDNAAKTEAKVERLEQERYTSVRHTP
jgi:hypothetical protein